MRLHALVASTLSLVAVLVAAPAFAAEEAPAPNAPALKRRPLFIGVSGGIAYVTAEHEKIIRSSFATSFIGMHAGYSFNDTWAVGFELTGSEKYMTRNGPEAPFMPVGYSPQAGCDSCSPPPIGGWLAKVTTVFGSFAPRVEYTPFGKDSLYLGASAGLAFLYGAADTLGASGSARAGYRFRVGADILSFSVEGGIQGQYYGANEYAYIPYAALMMRPYW